MSVKAGIPELVEASGKDGLTVGAEKTIPMIFSVTTTESDEVTVKVPAEKAVTVEFSVGRAVIDLPYSAKVEITCMNNSKLYFSSTGTYNGVAYTAVQVNTKVK